MKVNAVTVEDFSLKVCPKTDCLKCVHNIGDFGELYCLVHCNITGLIPVADLSHREKVLLGLVREHASKEVRMEKRRYRIKWTQTEHIVGRADKTRRFSDMVAAASVQEAMRLWQRKRYVNACIESIALVRPRRTKTAAEGLTSVNTH